MRFVAQIKVESFVSINSDEAAMIEHLTGYNIAKQFAMEFNKTYTADQIEKTLRNLRQKVQVILKTTEEARRAFEKAAGKNDDNEAVFNSTVNAGKVS